MNAIQTLLTEHIDIWTAADTGPKSGRGRSSANAASVYGIRKLRELILELAVRGKLVPQDAKDESASELLKRIQANIKVVPVDQHPFSLPKGWEWMRFGDALDFQGGGQPPKHAFSDTKQDGYVQLIQIRDLGERPQPVFIKKELAAKFCTDEDIMIGRYGASVGKVFWGKDGAYNVALVKIVDEFGIYYNRFLYEFFRCPHGQSFFSGISRSAQAGFNKSDIAGQLMPVCSHTEQHRIVAKVDELMALCDQLETRHNNATEAHEILVSHLLGTLTQSQSAADFSASWHRIAAHFDTLFTTEASIDALKKTLLQLAVMGKLVPQDSNEEPASVLIKHIQAEKTKLIAEGNIKKDKPFPQITDEEKPFDLPQAWEWVRFGEVSIIKGELVRPEDFPDFQQVAPDCIEKGSGRLTEVRTVKESGVRGPNSRFYKGQIVYSKIRPSLSKAVLVDFDGLCSADMYPVDTFIDPQFMLKQILSECFLEQVRIAENRIKMPKLNQESLTAFVLPLPPLSEQHRIVAKVDELMALCEKLETRITEANQLQQKLADVVVEQAAV